MAKKLLTYKEARERAGIDSQTEMAKKMGMIRETYRYKEEYEKHMKANELMLFCDIVGCNQSDLLILGYNYK